MDELQQTLARVTSDLERALGEQKGHIDFDSEYREEVTVTGDRIGYARLAVELLRVATPVSVGYADLPGPDDRLLNSPIAGYRRDDAAGKPMKMSWKDRLMASGCILVAIFAVSAFFRGCAAFEQDIERIMK